MLDLASLRVMVVHNKKFLNQFLRYCKLGMKIFFLVSQSKNLKNQMHFGGVWQTMTG